MDSDSEYHEDSLSRVSSLRTGGGGPVGLGGLDDDSDLPLAGRPGGRARILSLDNEEASSLPARSKHPWSHLTPPGDTDAQLDGDGEEAGDRVSEMTPLSQMTMSRRPRASIMRRAGVAGGAGRGGGGGGGHAHTLSAPHFNLSAAISGSGNGGASTASSTSSTLAPIAPPPDKSGWLYKRGNLNSSWKKRWFVLRYQTLKYYKKPSDTKAKGHISLSAAALTPGSSDKMRRLHGFEISSLKYTRVFVIHAENEREMKEWMECLEENIQYVRQVIEREKKQQARASGAGGAGGANTGPGGLTLDVEGRGGASSSLPKHPFSATHASSTGKSPAPEDNLDLEVGESYLRSLGIPLRLSTWRRDVPRLAFDEEAEKMVATTALRSALRMGTVSAYAAHNTYPLLAVGFGSDVPASSVDKGCIQLLQLDNRESVSAILEMTRFGDVAADAADWIDPDESDEDDEDEDEEEEEEEHRSDQTHSTHNMTHVATLQMPCTGEISALHWVDDKLFAASSGGIVVLYTLPDNLTTSSAATTNFHSMRPTQIFYHSQAASIPPPTPGKWTPSSRITHVSLNPLDKRTLLTVANQHFFLWDLEKGAGAKSNGGRQAPLVQRRPLIVESAGTPLFAAAWSNHLQGHVMLAGEDGTMRLIDTRLLLSLANESSSSPGRAVAGILTSDPRNKVLSWSTRLGAGLVHHIAFSPLVSHWVATADSEGLVKVWDMRYGPDPVRVLSGHVNAVTKVAWSRTHAELLVSTSVDRSVRVWNLRVAPHYLVHVHEGHPREDDEAGNKSKELDFQSPLIHASWSPSPAHPFQVLVGSLEGEVAALNMRRELMTNFVNHRPLNNVTAPATAANATAAATNTKEGAANSKQQKQENESKEKMEAESDEKKSGDDSVPSSSPPAPSSFSSSQVVVAQRSPSDILLEHEIESLLYLRDFDRGFRALVGLAQRYWVAGQHSFAESLLKLSSAGLFEAAAKEPTKVLIAAGLPLSSAGAPLPGVHGTASHPHHPPNPNTAKSFHQLVSDLSRFLPPSTLRSCKVDGLTLHRLQFLKTRLGVLQLIKANKWRDVLALGGEICAHLERGGGVPSAGPANAPVGAASGGATGASGGAAGSGSSDSSVSGPPPPPLTSSMDQFDSSTLEQILLCILPHDHVRGLELAMRIGTTLKEAGNFSLFYGVGRALFHPTIYERMDDSSTAAKQFSWVRTLASLAHTQVGGGGQGSMMMPPSSGRDRDDSRSESESESESSTNSSMSSSASSRKPSAAAMANNPFPHRPSVSVGGVNVSTHQLPHSSSNAGQGSAAAGSSSGGARSGYTTDAHHAQITLDRDLRNPKIVLTQLTLLHAMLSVIATEGDSEGASDQTSSTSASSSSPSARTARSATDSDPPPRWNPYLSTQPSSISSKISIDTLGLAPLSTQSAKEVARLMEEQKEPLKLLPGLVHLLYVHALLSSKKYDLLFIAASRFFGSSSGMRGYQLTAVLEGVCNEVATPRFVRFLDRLLSREGGEGRKSSGATSPSASAAAVGANLPKLQAAALTILNILFNADTLPSALSSLLPRYFREVHEEVRRTLTDMRTNPAYTPSTSYATAQADVRAKAEAILTQMTRIKNHAKTMEPHCTEQVQEFATMLRRFVE